MDAWQTIPLEDDTIRLEVQVRAPTSLSYEDVIELQDRVAGELQLPLALDLIVILFTELDPVIPPTPTFTPTPTETLTPTPGPSPTPTSPISTPTPTITPIPTPLPTSLPALAVVADTGGRWVRLHWRPNGSVAGAISEGTVVQLLPEKELAGGLYWVKITDAEGRTGWIAEQYLVSQQN